MRQRQAFPAATFVAIWCFSAAAMAADPLPRAKPEDVGMSSERLARITEAVNSEIARGQMPGAVVAVARRGKLVFLEAYGYRDKSAGTAMTSDSIFSLASMTKPMVAVAALQLYEQGKLLMDEPLSKYFPKFAEMQVAVLDAKKENIIDKAPAARKITIQDLFRHTSGLSYGTSGNTVLHKMYPAGSIISSDLTGPEFLDKLSSLPLVYQPGTVWEYGFGFDVLGLVVESITRQSLDQYLRDHVWKPLNMADTAFVIPAGKEALYARALPNDPETGRPQPAPAQPRKAKFDCGGACAISTAGDYLRFISMLVDNGRLGDTRILGRKTAEFMLSNQLSPNTKNQVGDLIPAFADYGFGLGVAVRTTPGGRIMGSVGDFSWPGANGVYWGGDPREELAFVWLASTPGAVRQKYREMARSLIYQAIVN